MEPSTLDILAWWYTLDVVDRIEILTVLSGSFGQALSEAGSLNPPQYVIDAVKAKPELMED